VSLENLDRSVLEAANDLGARRWAVFWRVTFPLSLPGIAAAFVFVFIPTIGEFVTPSLVGGRSGLMYGNAISELFLQGLDWQTGSVLALFLVVVVGVLLALSSRFLRTSGVGL
jgi:spermidine/putrescine transport system permease protein